MADRLFNSLDTWVERVVQKNMKSFTVRVNVAASEQTDVMIETCFERIKEHYDVLHDKFLLPCNGKVKLVVMNKEKNFDLGKFWDKSQAIREMFKKRLGLPVDKFVLQHKKSNTTEFVFKVDFYEEF